MVRLRTVVRAAIRLIAAREDIRLPTHLAEIAHRLTVRLRITRHGHRIAHPVATAHLAVTVHHEAIVRHTALVAALILQAEAVIRVEAVATRAAAAVTDAANHRVSGFDDSNPDLTLSFSDVSHGPDTFGVVAYLRMKSRMISEAR